MAHKLELISCRPVAIGVYEYQYANDKLKVSFRSCVEHPRTIEFEYNEQTSEWSAT